MFFPAPMVLAMPVSLAFRAAVMAWLQLRTFPKMPPLADDADSVRVVAGAKPGLEAATAAGPTEGEEAPASRAVALGSSPSLARLLAASAAAGDPSMVCTV